MRRVAGARAARSPIGSRATSRPALDALTLFAHWITPPILPKRFDTRFYIAAAPQDQTAVHDGGEAVDSIWIEPARALAEAAAGRFTLVLPTRLNLELLGQSATAAEAISAARARRVTPIEPLADQDGDRLSSHHPRRRRLWRQRVRRLKA